MTHFKALYHVLSYISYNVGQDIILKGNAQLTFQAFTDSNRCTSSDTRRSISDYVMLLGNSPINWKSKKPTMLRSFFKDVYRSMATAASGVTWLVRLLIKLGVFDLLPITLNCDNQFGHAHCLKPDFPRTYKTH